MTGLCELRYTNVHIDIKCTTDEKGDVIQMCFYLAGFIITLTTIVPQFCKHCTLCLLILRNNMEKQWDCKYRERERDLQKCMPCPQ